MFKKSIFIFLIFCFFITSQTIAKTVLSNNPNGIEVMISQQNKPITNDYNQEEILLCPTFSELEKDSSLNEDICTSSDDIFTKEDIRVATMFLKKIKYAVKESDKDLFVNSVTFPLEINNLVIKNKEGLYIENFDLNKIFRFSKEERLFWNYQGFFYGNIFFYVENGNIIELKIR